MRHTRRTGPKMVCAQTRGPQGGEGRRGAAIVKATGLFVLCRCESLLDDGFFKASVSFEERIPFQSGVPRTSCLFDKNMENGQRGAKYLCIGMTLVSKVFRNTTQPLDPHLSPPNPPRRHKKKIENNVSNRFHYKCIMLVPMLVLSPAELGYTEKSRVLFAALSSW